MNATFKMNRPAGSAETRKNYMTHKDTHAARLETLRRKSVRRMKYTAAAR